MCLKIQSSVVIVALGLMSAIAAPTRASQVLFYAGNPVVGGAQEDQIDNNEIKLTDVGYDNFIVPAGKTYTINDVYGEFGLPPGDTFSSAVYEFRTNMDAGGGGTLIASDELPVTITTGVGGGINGGDAFPPQRVQVNLPTPLLLTGGASGTTYWVGFAPDTTGGSLNTFAGQSGGNSPTGVNLPPTSDTFEHEIYSLSGQNVNTFVGGSEISIGFEGTLTVPEPAGMLMGLTSVMIAATTRPRKRAAI